MEDDQRQTEERLSPEKNPVEGLLWLIFCILLTTVAAILITRNWPQIQHLFNPSTVENFDEIAVSDGFHNIRVEHGQSWQLSYEANHERSFSGLVRHTSPINEPAFSILTHDILVTSGDFSNPELVDTSVSNHHFTWYSAVNSNPNGTINLLHTVPMNEEIRQQLDAIQTGDQVIITGWDIFQIQGYDKNGKYIGYWEDSGCNTTLVIRVEIIR